MLLPGDDLILIEDAVVYASRASLPQALPERSQIHCLRDDLQARGLMGRSGDEVNRVSMADFVELCVHHESVVSWN